MGGWLRIFVRRNRRRKEMRERRRREASWRFPQTHRIFDHD
jgi:hypothetical protein